jgi:uncharacterized membrane protein YidH (DUF202 family)
MRNRDPLLGVFLVGVGLLAIWARKGFSDVAESMGRWHGHLFGKPTPRTAVLWGIGVIVVGLLVLLGY